ncbi:MAG: hypothetical protein GY729_05520 [Desulfobacteraceae bacterium]|nr:hypothetical protein [Desulfobacteraceae bacterium]
MRILTVMIATIILLPGIVFATQLHASAEGIITHQIGHIFFLISMLVLMFTIKGKGLDRQKGWRLIQISAFFFILWNLDAVFAHFFDNQIHAVKFEDISFGSMRIVTQSDSPLLALLYYVLKMDHLLCVPAMLFFFSGLSRLVENQKRETAKQNLT